MHIDSKLYFDIETTGLSRRSSHLTVIGTAYNNGNETVIKQFISRRPNDEISLLNEFIDFSKDFETLVHFNGNTFDIPYVTSKCAFYGLPSPFRDMESHDLYKLAKKYAKLFDTEDHKQKSLEKLFGFQRTDRISGKECINAYLDYITKGDEDALKRLVLHNEDDLKGMEYIENALQSLQHFTDGDFTAEPYADTDKLCLKLTLKKPLKVPLHIDFPGNEEAAPFSLEINKDSGTFLLPSFTGTLRYYFKDYKNYYYLPLEGRAIHCSVGQYVDKEYREKAKKETAFEPAEGIFYPQSESVVLPEFKLNCNDKISYFRTKDIKNSCCYTEIAAAAINKYLKKG